MAIDISIYYPIIFVISMLILILIILTYIASKVFKINELDAYLSIELSELINSFLIMFFAIGFFVAADSIASSMAQTYLPGFAAAGAKATTVASYVIQKNAIDVQNGMQDIFTIQVCLSIQSMLQRRVGEQVLTMTYKLFPALDSIVSVMNLLGYGLVAALSSLKAQLLLINFIDGTMAAFFLPAGIILRFFPPTRESGVFLIAFAIGFQTIFPTAYIINEAASKDLYQVDKDAFSVFNGYPSQNFAVSMFCGLQYVVYGYIASPGIPTSIGGLGSVDKLGPALRTIFSEYRINLFNIESWLLPIIRSIAYLSLPAFFLPAFAISITIAFVNATTKFMLARM